MHESNFQPEGKNAESNSGSVGHPFLLYDIVEPSQQIARTFFATATDEELIHCSERKASLLGELRAEVTMLGRSGEGELDGPEEEVKC